MATVQIAEILAVLDLETLIEAKQIANRDKDKLHLLYLRETLRLRRIKEGGR